jgi:hypothetical protein
MTVIVCVVMCVRVFGRSDVFHLVDVTAFGAALDGAVAGDLLMRRVSGFVSEKGGGLGRGKGAYG